MRFVSVLVFLALSVSACGNRSLRFQVEFEESPGLKSGSNVRYLGLSVGKVERVFVQDKGSGSSPQVVVAVAIKDSEVHIRRDDIFGLSTQGLLGEEYLSITPGPTTSAVVTEGSTVQGQASALPVKEFSSVVDAYGLITKLDALPKDKRDQMLETFNRLLDDALDEQLQKPPKAGLPTAHNR